MLPSFSLDMVYSWCSSVQKRSRSIIQVHGTCEFTLYQVSHNGWSSQAYTIQLCHVFFFVVVGVFFINISMARLNFIQHTHKHKNQPRLFFIFFFFYLSLVCNTSRLSKEAFLYQLLNRNSFRYLIPTTMTSIMSTPEQTLGTYRGWCASVCRHSAKKMWICLFDQL